MSKNIKIAEKGVDKEFDDVDKVQANKMDHGTQNWVPIDEAWKYADLDNITIDKNGRYTAAKEKCDGFDEVEVDLQFEELSVTENDVYDAEKEGCAGFSKVTVDTSDKLGVATFNENGEYNARDDGYDGYYRVVVNPEYCTSITIDANGTYKAKDENYDGYSEVIVNVPNVPNSLPSGKTRTGIATSKLRQCDPVVLFPEGITDPVFIGTANKYSEVWNNWNYWFDNSGLMKSISGKNMYSYPLAYYWRERRDSTTLSSIVERKGLRLNDYYDFQSYAGSNNHAVMYINEPGEVGEVFHDKFRIFFIDGNQCDIELDRVYEHATSKPGICCYGGLISVVYCSGIQSSNKTYTVNIYNQEGELLTEKVYSKTSATLGFFSGVVPVSTRSVAGWDDKRENLLITPEGLIYNHNRLSANVSNIGVYDGKYYVYTKDNKTYCIGISDVTSNYTELGSGERIPNSYGHYRDGNEIKDIETGERVYPNITIGGDSWNERDDFILDIYANSAEVWLKNPGGKIAFSPQIPTVEGAMAGIMKSSCDKGERGTIISLFN